MKLKMNGEELIFYLGDRIDSKNAKEIETDLYHLLENKYSQLTLDFSNVYYISSSGLKILLRLKKDGIPFKCIELSNEVYDVMELTGFTKIMDIQKRTYK